MVRKERKARSKSVRRAGSGKMANTFIKSIIRGANIRETNIVMYRIEEMNDALIFSDDDLQINDITDHSDDFKLSNDVTLYNQFTVDLFCNAKLLTNIRETDEELIFNCNTGTITTILIADLRGYRTV